MDATEGIRRIEQCLLNVAADERAPLTERYGRVWDTKQLGTEYEVIGFLAPYVVVVRRTDGRKGSLQFQHQPRYYFNWQEE